MSTEQKQTQASKKIFSIIRKSLTEDTKDFWHIHLEEFDEDDRALATKILNRLARRGVIFRAHSTMYVRNTYNNRLLYRS